MKLENMNMTITKLQILHSSKGHQTHISGTGIHRNLKKNPKGNRKAQVRKALSEY